MAYRTASSVAGMLLMASCAVSSEDSSPKPGGFGHGASAGSGGAAASSGFGGAAASSGFGGAGAGAGFGGAGAQAGVGPGGGGPGGSGPGGSGPGGDGPGGGGPGGGGPGGGGGLGGGGGIGAVGGIAGSEGDGGAGGSSGSSGSSGTSGVGGVGGSGGGKAPIIPPVSGDCPRFANGTVTVGGLGGIQIVAGSKPASPTAPLVFYWHGTGGSSGEYALQAAAVQQGVVSEGGVLVSFNGTTGGDLLSGTLIFGANDFKITDQIVACAVRDANVDPRRIYATGCSAGGLFSDAMAAQRSNYMAAVASNSGGWVLPVGWQNDYTPALMTIHGRMGVDVVIVDFSQTSATADQAFKARGGFVINCDHGGGHCGGAGFAGNIWQFFKAHPYGVNPKPWSSLPAGFNSACKIY
jgi:predicted esterase